MFHKRKHIRLREFNYASNNAYFITVCVKDKKLLLGEIRNSICGLSKIGAEAALRLQRIPELYPDTILDEFIIMPNHLHFILIIDSITGSEASNAFSKPVAESISMHTNHFKGAVKKWAKNEGYLFDWQRRFHDHVIRNEKEYWAIKDYISNNPRLWPHDRFYL